MIETNQQLHPVARNRQTWLQNRAAGAGLPALGLRPPAVNPAPAHSHPDWRWPRTLIAAPHAMHRQHLPHLQRAMRL